MTWRGRSGALRKRYGPKKGHRELTPSEKAQLRIARENLKMPDAMLGVMLPPGVTVEEAKRDARETIRRLTGKK